MASLDMTQSQDGLLIPVTIAGQARKMIVDTGSPLSSLDPNAVQELGLITERIVQGRMYDSSGRQFTKLVHIPELQIGNLKATDKRFLVFPENVTSDKQIAGLLGADFLRHYDIELDFAANKLNIFDRDHCPGKVIYWPASAVAVVPMHVNSGGYIFVPVTLEGKKFDALFDTGTFGTILEMSAAEGEFGLSPNSPGVQPVGSATESPRLYSHKFASLQLEGIAFNDPTVFLREDATDNSLRRATGTGTRLPSLSENNGDWSLILGTNELRHLHLFISYGEQKLYITAASPPPATAQR